MNCSGMIELMGLVVVGFALSERESGRCWRELVLATGTCSVILLLEILESEVE